MSITTQESLPPTSTEEEVDIQQYSALRQLLQRDRHLKAVDLCNKILARCPKDVNAIHVKIVCLIHLGQFDQAIECAALSQEFVFEKAYCLYRRGNFDDALKACQLATNRSENNFKNLEAQINYKLGNYQESFALFNDLISNIEQPSEELLSNYYTSSLAAGEAQRALTQFPIEEISVTENIDLLYNIASLYIAIADYDKAKDVLERAVSAYKATGSCISAEDIPKEIAAVVLQNICMEHILGYTSDSLIELSKTIIRLHGKEPEISAVATNNLAILKGYNELPDTLRRLRAINCHHLETKLSSLQTREISCNKAILYMCMRKFDECLKIVSEVEIGFGISLRTIAIKASCYICMKKYEQSDELLLFELQKSTNQSVAQTTLALLLAQSYIIRSRFTDAKDVIAGIQSLSCTPVGVSAILVLKELASSVSADIEPTSEYMFKVINKLSSAVGKGGQGNVVALTIMKMANKLQLEGKHKDAILAYKTLLNNLLEFVDSNSRLTITARLTVSLSYFDDVELAKYSSVFSEIDTSHSAPIKLEAKGVPKHSKTLHQTSRPETLVEKMRSVNVEKLKARNLRRRAHQRDQYLKNLQDAGKYDPNRPIKPDPERWLPRNQRASFKRNRKNKNKFVGGQGSGDGSQKEMLKLDAYARAKKEEETTLAKAVLESKATVPKGKGKKKK